MAKAGARILLLDIETWPIIAQVWSIWNVNVGINQIERDWSILSFAAKWLDEKSVIYDDVSKEKNLSNDKPLMKHLWKLLDEADIIIAQNGKKFDIPKIKARMLEHGFKPPSPFKVIDTKDIAKKNFGFTSNRLEFLTGRLCHRKKSQHKKFPGHELWIECWSRNKSAWAEMKAYNIEDVLSMEELYLKMRAWDNTHPNLALYVDDTTPRCPKCQSTKIQKNGFKVLSVGKYQRYLCVDCGASARGGQMVNTKEKRATLLRVIASE